MKCNRWRSRLLGVAMLESVACASGPRFKDAAPVWYVDDARDIPEPKEHEWRPVAYFADILALRRLNRSLSIPDKEPAHNTNCLDEVPNSTWFTNRIGVRRVTPAEAARGPVVDGPPQLPLLIVKGKSGGMNPGFFAKGKKGRTFLIKFDTKENPGMQTGTGVVVNRFFWTIGFNVPSDTIFHFRREDLLLSPDATMVSESGKKRSMTLEDVDEILDTSPTQSDGSYRSFASELLDGIPVGGIHPEGLRKDDPNDKIPHQHRRELRGLRVFSAWLGHTDMKEDNSMDMYVEEDGRHFVRHYLLDFGEALGAHQAEKGRYEDGWENIIDWEMQTKALLALGLWKRPWEDQEETKWPSIGAFAAEHFDPELWREAYPYWPFFETDTADAYWAAKIIMRFDRPVVEAIVAEGKWRPDASAYMVDTLLERARRIGEAYIETVTALDAFHVDGGDLCAFDLGIHYGLAGGGVAERLDAAGETVDEYVVERNGRVCFPMPKHGRYTIDRLRTRRGHRTNPVMQVHYKGGKNARVLGIIRVERR